MSRFTMIKIHKHFLQLTQLPYNILPYFNPHPNYWILSNVTTNSAPNVAGEKSSTPTLLQREGEIPTSNNKISVLLLKFSTPFLTAPRQTK